MSAPSITSRFVPRLNCKAEFRNRSAPFSLCNKIESPQATPATGSNCARTAANRLVAPAPGFVSSPSAATAPLTTRTSFSHRPAMPRSIGHVPSHPRPQQYRTRCNDPTCRRIAPHPRCPLNGTARGAGPGDQIPVGSHPHRTDLT